MKKIIAVITVVVLLLPLCAFNGSAAEYSETDAAYIDGQIISRITMLTKDLTGDGWSWDHIQQRLELSGYDGGAIFLPWLSNYDGYNINLAAGTENVITGNAFGIELPCGKITGSGKLTINITDTTGGGKVKHDLTGEDVDFIAGIHPYKIGGSAEKYKSFKINNGGTLTINVTIPEFSGTCARYGIYSDPVNYQGDLYINGAGAVNVNMIIEKSNDDHGSASVGGIVNYSGNTHIMKTARVNIDLVCKSNPYFKRAPYADGLRSGDLTLANVASLDISCSGFEYSTLAKSTGIFIEREFTMKGSANVNVFAARPLFTMSGKVRLEGDGMLSLICTGSVMNPIEVNQYASLDLYLDDGYKTDILLYDHAKYYKTLPLRDVPLSPRLACAGSEYPSVPEDVRCLINGAEVVEVRSKMFGKIVTGDADYGFTVGLEVKVAATGDYSFVSGCTASTPGIEWEEGFATVGMDAAHELWFTCVYTVGYNEGISVAVQPSETVYYMQGGTITASCLGTSVDQFGYQWVKSTVKAGKTFWSNIDGKNDKDFVVTGADESWNGKKIACRIYNDNGYVQTKTVTIVMNENGEAPPSALRGDLNGDGKVTSEDAIYLLYHVFFSSDYPVSQDCDFNKDGKVTSEDAIYLLYHVFFNYDYPLL